MSVLLYADDILLIAPSVSSINKRLHICEQELRKIFRTMSAEVVQNCMLLFSCVSMQECVLPYYQT